MARSCPIDKLPGRRWTSWRNRGTMGTARTALEVTVCHALPVKIVALTGPDTARVSLGGMVREVSVALIDDPKPGDYVLLHVGFALARIDEAEALRTLALLAGEGPEPFVEFAAAEGVQGGAGP